MSAAASIAGAEWLRDPDLQRLLAALSREGETARVAGGAVRNALLGEAVADVDVATTTPPPETIRRAEAAGFRTFPTGIEHGTVTVVDAGRPFEVTTLRADVETDGRRATVAFGRDWAADAARRDFTINAIYADADGTVIDLVGGLADLANRTLRFIGDPEQRIREDYLRILRFFRFFAWHGRGRPDADGLRACARLKEGLDRLSAERVWAELLKLLGAPDPARALLWMRQAGVLGRVLPESEKWGIDAIHALVKAEGDLGWTADALLRLAAIVPPDAERMKGLAARMKLSRLQAERLEMWASAPPVEPTITEGDLAKLLYRAGVGGIVDRLRLALASARGRAAENDAALIETGGYARLLAFASPWERPVLPVQGRDLVALGLAPGPALGATLAALEAAWVESGFRLDRETLLGIAGRR